LLKTKYIWLQKLLGAPKTGIHGLAVDELKHVM